VKAPSFAYAKPGSLADVFQLLEQHGEDARILAGGQSLLASLNMRLSAPSVLVDITGLPGLSGISTAAGKVRIGALTTHRAIETSAEIARSLPLLTQAAPHIAHVAIRNVGTIGGSIALADPAAEWPTCCIALDAEAVIASPAGERRVRARDFFKGLYTTALRPGEVLVAVEIPIPGAGYRSVFLELARRRGDYAMAGIGAVARLEAGRLTDVRLAYLNLGPTPVLARNAMRAIEGKPVSAEVVAAAQAALDADLDPSADIYSSVPTKMHLARVITGRALAALLA
jgi:carbon-monoxide dehydrogenase medium subunit